MKKITVALLTMTLTSIAYGQSGYLDCSADEGDDTFRLSGAISTIDAKLKVESEEIYRDSADYEVADFDRQMRENEDDYRFAKYLSGDSTWFYFKLSIPKDFEARTSFPGYFGWAHDEGLDSAEWMLTCI